MKHREMPGVRWVRRFGCLAVALSGIACGSDDGTSGDGDGDGDMIGDGDAGDGDVGDGDVGDGDVSGDGDSEPGDGDGDIGDGDAGDGDVGDGDAPDCVIDLECDPTPPESTGDFAQDCVNRINQFRTECHCLEPLERWTEGEACAEANAEYDQMTMDPHSGWREAACEDESGPLSSDYYGWATNECTGSGSPESVINNCLRGMYGEGAEWAQSLGRTPTQQDYDDCEDSCYGQYGHFIAMTSAAYSRVACGITSDPEYWSVQNFE